MSDHHDIVMQPVQKPQSDVASNEPIIKYKFIMDLKKIQLNTDGRNQVLCIIK
jgi:hypothetical protein